MRDLKKYWKEVRELERNLPPFVWVMSLDDAWRGLAGGVLTEVPAAEAARLLHAKSHRAATGEEIAVHLDRQSAAVRQEFHDSLRRQGITVVTMESAPSPEKLGPEHAAKEPAPKARARNLR